MASAQPAVSRSIEREWNWNSRTIKRNRDKRLTHIVTGECEFESEVIRLGLAGETLQRMASGSDIAHLALRWWAKRHAYTRYIPTELLDAWGIRVDLDLEMP